MRRFFLTSTFIRVTNVRVGVQGVGKIVLEWRGEGGGGEWLTEGPDLVGAPGLCCFSYCVLCSRRGRRSLTRSFFSLPSSPLSPPTVASAAAAAAAAAALQLFSDPQHEHPSVVMCKP